MALLQAGWRWLPAGARRALDRSVAASFASAAGAGGLAERSVVHGFAEVHLPGLGSTSDNVPGVEPEEGVADEGDGEQQGVATSSVCRKKPRLTLRHREDAASPGGAIRDRRTHLLEGPTIEGRSRQGLRLICPLVVLIAKLCIASEVEHGHGCEQNLFILPRSAAGGGR